MIHATIGRTVRKVFGTRSRAFGWFAVAAAVGIGVGVWQIGGGGSAKASVSTVTAGRGDVVVSVGGVGKVVAGWAAARGTAPPAAGGSSPGGSTASAGSSQATAAGALAGSGRTVFPQVAGRVVAVFVSPGRHVVAGQVLARLDPGVARSNLVVAQAAVDQAKAQLEADRSGVTPQSLASARASVTSARAALVAARQALAHATRVNRDTIAAAAQQVSQARSTITSDSARLGPSPQSAASAKAGVVGAREILAAAEAALADTRASNAQQASTLQHNVEAAMRDLGGDQSRLERDLAIERRFCGTNSPIITGDTSSECANAAATVASDQQAILKDRAALQAAQDAETQGQINARQSEHQASAQVASARSALESAQAQLAALKVANGQTLAKDRQALATARSGLTQARSKAAESASQARAQAQSATVGLVNANGALTALRQGAPGALIAQDRSKLVAARAQVQASRAALEQTIVRSPARGTVTWVFVAPGSPADASTPVAAIADLAHLAVSVDLSEFDAARVKHGLRAVVSVDALGGRRFAGKVLFESLTGVDNGGVVTFPVRVGLTRFSGLKPGMNVSVRIIVAQRRNVVRVPLEAVSRDTGTRALVTVVDSSGRESTRSVKLGLSDNKNVEVRSGLRAGERVLIASATGA